MRISDWSSDVCSSDLASPTLARGALHKHPAPPELSWGGKPVRRKPQGLRRTFLLRQRRPLLARLDERPDDAARDQSDGHAEADQRRELRPAQHEIRDENLRPDEHHTQRARILPITERMPQDRPAEIKHHERKNNQK